MASSQYVEQESPGAVYHGMSLAPFARVACFCPTTMCVLHVQDCDVCQKCKHSLRVCKESYGLARVSTTYMHWNSLQEEIVVMTVNVTLQ